MTRLSAAQREMVRHAETGPISAAYHAAAKVAGAVMEKAKGINPALWPLVLATEFEAADDAPQAIIAAVGKLAPFVRANPDAPAEALYRHAAAEAVHDAPKDGFAAQPIHVRLAYETFRTTLIAVDRALAAERDRLPKDHPKPRPVPIEDTIFDPEDPPLALVGYARPKAKPAMKGKKT